MMTQTLYINLTKRIHDLAPRALKQERQVKWGDNFSTYGIYTQPLRALLLEYKTRVLDMTFDARVDLAARLMGDDIEEHNHAAVAILGWSLREFSPKSFSALDALLDNVKSWGVTDDFCVQVMHGLVEKFPAPVIKLCRRWNRSPNPWKRRASMVTFTRKIGESGKFTDVVLKLADRVLWDDELLVRKAVGWALKDNLRGNQQAVLAYILELEQKHAPALITAYALKDLPAAERHELLHPQD